MGSETPFLEPAIHLIPLLNQHRSSSCACTRALPMEGTMSLNPTTMTLQNYMTTENPNPELDTMFQMLKDLLNQGIKLAFEAQFQALQKMIRQRLTTTLSTTTTNQDRICELMRQEILRLQNHIQDLTRELPNIIANRITPTYTQNGMAASVPVWSDLSIAAAAAEREAPQLAAKVATPKLTKNTTPTPVYFHQPTGKAATDVKLPTRPS